jgi:hypothetical protein
MPDIVDTPMISEVSARLYAPGKTPRKMHCAGVGCVDIEVFMAKDVTFLKNPYTIGPQRARLD